MLFVSALQEVPAVGQSFGAVQAPVVVLASQRQIGRQVRTLLIRLQISPGAQSAADVQVIPSVLVRVASRQAQST